MNSPLGINLIGEDLDGGIGLIILGLGLIKITWEVPPNLWYSN